MLIIKGISQDIRNALELSNAPSADNLFATMDDIDTLAEEADLLDINYGENSFQVSGVGNNKLIIDDTNGLKYGDTSNYCLISPNGTLRLYGNAISYDDLMFDGSRVRTGSSAPSYTRYKRDVTGTSHGVYYWYFSDSIDQNVIADIQFPHCWKEGSTIHPHVHWFAPLASGSAGQTIVWQIEYLWSNINEVIPTYTTLIEGVSTQNPITQHTHYITSLPTITVSNKKLSSCMSLVLTRLTSHTSNTFASPIALQSFDIHIQKDGFGSSEELIK